MYYISQAIKNKNQKQPKVSFAQYLFNADEPIESNVFDAPVRFEIGLSGSSFFMKRHITQLAKHMRDHY